MLDQLTYDQMQQHVGTTFRAEVPNAQPIDLQLTEVLKVMESQAARLKRTAFSLYFAGPRQPVLVQQIYRLHHPAFGEPLDIFLVPVAATAENMTYEAVFT